MVGLAFTATKHYNFVRALEDPSGFGRALDNIQDRTGRFLPQGPAIIRQSRMDQMPDVVDSANGKCPSSFEPKM